MPMTRRAGRRSARNGAASGMWSTARLTFGARRSVRIARKPTAISDAVPKNGPRQEMEPRSPPASGPTASPRPRAASYRMIAPATPPLAAPTIEASAVEMNRAFPRPQPARKPMMAPTELDEPARAANTTMIASPMSRARLAPTRLENQLVKNIAAPVTSRYVVNSSSVWVALARSSEAIAGRIGSTRPIPMNDTTAANAMAHTAIGCRSRLEVRASWCVLIGRLPA
jgi:hypothetical protein